MFASNEPRVDSAPTNHSQAGSLHDVSQKHIKSAFQL